MKVTARQRSHAFAPLVNEHLLVKSNPLGALQNIPVLKYASADSIRVYVWSEVMGVWSHTPIHYQTITDFLTDWHIVKARTHRIHLPLLRRTYGLGDMFALFAERAPLWFKAKFNGCLDRREWWNYLLQISPGQIHVFGHAFGSNPTHAQLSTLLFDNTMDIRRALRARGENPFDYEEAPRCDVCDTWVATHVVESKNGSAYLVCDKPQCQDHIASVIEANNNKA